MTEAGWGTGSKLMELALLPIEEPLKTEGASRRRSKLMEAALSPIKVPPKRKRRERSVAGIIDEYLSASCRPGRCIDKNGVCTFCNFESPVPYISEDMDVDLDETTAKRVATEGLEEFNRNEGLNLSLLTVIKCTSDFLVMSHTVTFLATDAGDRTKSRPVCIRASVELLDYNFPDSYVVHDVEEITDWKEEPDGDKPAEEKNTSFTQNTEENRNAGKKHPEGPGGYGGYERHYLSHLKHPNGEKITENFKICLFNILKKRHPDWLISDKAMEYMNYVISCILKKLAEEASELATLKLAEGTSRLRRYHKKHKITSKEIHTAVLVVFSGRKAEFAAAKGIRAVRNVLN